MNYNWDTNIQTTLSHITQTRRGGGVHVACSRATTKRCSSAQKLSIKNAFIFKICATYLKISRTYLLIIVAKKFNKNYNFYIKNGMKSANLVLKV